MTAIVEVEAADRHMLAPLFAGCRYDRVSIDSVLEGWFGTAVADSDSTPTVARLDSGAFTLLGGDPGSAATRDLLRLAPIHFVTPQTRDWRSRLQHEFGTRIAVQPFTDFSAASIDPLHLTDLIEGISHGFRLRQIDRPLVEKMPADLGNDYFFEAFHSVDDFLVRGIGFCIVQGGRIVSAATSMARSNRAIDIEIETAEEFRKQGLGSVVAARLVLECLERGIEPRWLAANVVSERLALKLGYVQTETYETFAIA
jgi:GNAT superfamily N-acetyltransferase